MSSIASRWQPGFAAGPGTQEHHRPHPVGPPPFGDCPHRVLPGGCLKRAGLGDCESDDPIVGDRVDAASAAVEDPLRENSPIPGRDRSCASAASSGSARSWSRLSHLSQGQGSQPLPSPSWYPPSSTSSTWVSAFTLPDQQRLANLSHGVASCSAGRTINPRVTRLRPDSHQPGPSDVSRQEGRGSSG